MGNILGAAVIILILSAAAAKMHRDKKRGHGGCSGCPFRDSCKIKQKRSS